jgi:lipid-A-disaccharide synthase
VLALLPGSRPNEVSQILPGLVDAASLVSDQVAGLQVLLARAPNLPDALFAPLRRSRVPVAVVEGSTDDVLAACDTVVTASGTATVQAAIHERPMVIVYRVAPLSYALGRRLVHVDTFGMVNLVAGRRIAPELIQADFTPDAVAREGVRLLRPGEDREQAIAAMREVRARLGGEGASRRAARSVLDLIAGRARVGQV